VLHRDELDTWLDSHRVGSFHVETPWPVFTER
jgi:hypothetical protein